MCSNKEHFIIPARVDVLPYVSYSILSFIVVKHILLTKKMVIAANMCVIICKIVNFKPNSKLF